MNMNKTSLIDDIYSIAYPDIELIEDNNCDLIEGVIESISTTYEDKENEQYRS